VDPERPIPAGDGEHGRAGGQRRDRDASSLGTRDDGLGEREVHGDEDQPDEDRPSDVGRL
jgi:hypothetical protein